MSDYQTNGRDEMIRAQRAMHERTLNIISGKPVGLSAEAQKLAKLRDAQMREQRSGGERRPSQRDPGEAAMLRRHAAEVKDPNSGKHVAYERYQRMFGDRG